jgi:hypothetical protein
MYNDKVFEILENGWSLSCEGNCINMKLFNVKITEEV